MARGRVISLDGAGGGKIREKTKVFAFDASALAEGYVPARGDEVRFDKGPGGRVAKVRKWAREAEAAPAGGGGPPAPVRGATTGGRRTIQGQPREPKPAPEDPPRTEMAPSPPPQGEGFVNPYNFVPLHGKVVERSAPDPERHLRLTGPLVRFTVSLEFKTPASVSPVQRKDHEKTDDGVPAWYVRRDHGDHGKPIIPGASIKGALRTVLEILSGSCLSQLDSETSFSWRPIIPSQAGFLERIPNDQWRVFPAIDIRVFPDGGENPRTGDAWSGTVIDRGGPGLPLWYSGSGPGARHAHGTWVIGDPATRKKWQRVFESPARAVPLRASPQVVMAADLAQRVKLDADAKLASQQKRENTWDGWISVRLEDSIGRRRPSARYCEMDVGERRPVWYRRSGEQVTMLGDPALMRVAQTDQAGEPVTLRHVVLRSSEGDVNRSFLPCSDKAISSGACPACRLLGAVGVLDGASGLGGRVRISQAHCDLELTDGPLVELRPVGQPHASAQTFYLWDPDDPSIVASYCGGEFHIRGRKLYWHRRATTAADVRIPGGQRAELVRGRVLAKQVQAKELLPKGTRFTFRVDAESLDDAELGLLLLTLEPQRLARRLGDEREARHKIGGGKGLGLGTAKLTILNVALEYPAHRYSTKAIEAGPAPDGPRLPENVLDQWTDAAMKRFDLGPGRRDVAALLTLLDPNALPPDALMYPPGPVKEWESFRWFTERAAKDRRTGLPSRSREGRAVDPLRTVEELAQGRWQWRR